MKYYKFKKTKKYKFYNWLHEKIFKINISLLNYYNQNQISKKHFKNVKTEWNAQDIIISFFPIKMGCLYEQNITSERHARAIIKELLNNQ